MNRKVGLAVAVVVLVGAVVLVAGAVVSHVRARREANSPSVDTPPTYSGEVHFALAMTEPRDFGKSVQALRTAAKLDPIPHDAHHDNMLQSIARIGEEAQAFDLAALAWAETVRLREPKFGAANWTVIDARVNAARTEALAKLPVAHRSKLAEAAALTRDYAQHTQQGNFAAAATAARQALELRAALTGKRHADYFEGLINLASAHFLLGEFAKARPLLEDARDLGKPLGIENHPMFGRVLIALAHAQLQLGDSAAAKRLATQGLTIVKSTVGEQHPFHTEGEQVQAAIRAREEK